MCSRDIEAEVVPTARELGIGVVAYSPLGRGFLTGRITSPADPAEDDFRCSNPRFTGDAFQATMAVVREVQAIAAEKGVTAAQLALAWVLARGEDVVPIPGTRSETRLGENVASADVVLDAADLERIQAAAPPEASPGPVTPRLRWARSASEGDGPPARAVVPARTYVRLMSESTGTPENNAPAPAESAEKPVEQWATGDEPATGPQLSYLSTLAREAGREVPEGISKGEASTLIDELQAASGRVS